MRQQRSGASMWYTTCTSILSSSRDILRRFQNVVQPLKTCGYLAASEHTSKVGMPRNLTELRLTRDSLELPSDKAAKVPLYLRRNYGTDNLSLSRRVANA